MEDETNNTIAFAFGFIPNGVNGPLRLFDRKKKATKRGSV